MRREETRIGMSTTVGGEGEREINETGDGSLRTEEVTGKSTFNNNGSPSPSFVCKNSFVLRSAIMVVVQQGVVF